MARTCSWLARSALLALALAGTGLPDQDEPAKAPPRDHHTVGHHTYTDTNGDGIADREVAARTDGGGVVKEDRDGDGTYDVRYEENCDGSRVRSATIHERAPRMAEVRAGSRAPKEYFIMGLPAWQVLAALCGLAAIPVLIFLAPLVLWRARARRRAARSSPAQDRGGGQPPAD